MIFKHLFLPCRWREYVALNMDVLLIRFIKLPCAIWITIFVIIRFRHPQLEEEVSRGYVFRVLYSEALYFMYKREFKRAAKVFVTIVKKEIFFFKAYIRLIQCFLLWGIKG